MPETAITLQEKIDLLATAISRGRLIVQFGSQRVQYQSMEGMLLARDRFRSELDALSKSSISYPRQGSGLTH